MSKLICDICGTSYSDGVDKCPTCGYSRAFEEDVSDGSRRSAAREKVRGGRFSKKNVRKRLEMMAQAGHKNQEIVPAADIAAELKAIDAAAAEVRPAVQESQEAPACVSEEIPAVQEQEAAPVVVLMPEEEPEKPEPETAVEESAPEAEPIVILLPEEEPEQPMEEPEQVEPETAAEESAPEAEPIVLLLPDEEPEQPMEEPEQAEPETAVEESAPEAEPIVILLPEEEPEQPMEEPEQAEPETAVEETEPVIIPLPEEEPKAVEPEPEKEPVIPVVIPVEEAQAEPAEEEEKKKKGGLLLNIVLYTSLAVFLASAIYLLVSFGIPYLKEMDWPTRPAVETTVPTEEPTQAPTDAPTEAPTDAPTEAPTDPPTEPPTEAPTDPPTEAPTEPLLDVKLELNYYDLTFPSKGDVTQLKTKEIPLEDVTWISDDTSIVTINETGLITAEGPGRTTVRAIYGDQEVTVKIHCSFYS